MRIAQALTQRPADYDRNPTAIEHGYSADAVAPHALTNRDTYTVPSNRKLLLAGITLALRRAVAATAEGQSKIDISVGGVLLYTAWISSITVDNRQASELSGGAFVGPGATILIQTKDLSTGGSVDYHVGWLGTEFDT